MGLGALAAVLAMSHARFYDSETLNPVVRVALKLPNIIDNKTTTGASAPSANQTVAQDVNHDSARIPFEPRVPKNYVSSDDQQSLTNSNGTGENWLNVTIATGDNLSLIFGRVGLSKNDLHQILGKGKPVEGLLHLEPGQIVRIRTQNGQLTELVHEVDYRQSLHVIRKGGDFSIEMVTVSPEIRIATAFARIKSSLFTDGQEAGLPDRTIMELTDIFGWDVDFALDLREGDTFSVVYEEIYKNGEKVKNGRILAAEFVNQGRKLRAVYYEGKDGVEGYFSDKGDAMRKAFLRTPVNFTRITSRFSLARAHPILNTIRAHKGVDYAAPVGTPIRATADGKIAFVGQQPGYGNVVVMQHGDTYSTLYGHMSRFARDVTTSKHVRQGQTIGYVGQSGLATGPHLHYEFRINGIHRDPLTVKLPNSIPLDKRYFADFERKSAPMFERLSSLVARHATEDRSLVAQAGETPAPRSPRHRGANNQAN